MPLASLSSEMDSRTTCLNETPPTIECYARVWTVIGVDSVMSLEIRLLFESLEQGTVSMLHGSQTPR
ncbi:MAG: hypothetical protein CL912_20535 [Deltaproteobacteria bacterium]|nr:hypothetical protein [Deltaproteobacteria bacterium]